jgi:S-adenosylmethionine:tRNA ribosyltransferase-isomerase
MHVGGGTSIPVRTENLNDHKMHTEYCYISEEAANIINKAKAEGRRIIAVGTTSVRVLESAQVNGQIKPGAFETDIFIKPGFKFQMVDMLITNFHLPKTTLFMLVCAFAGTQKMFDAYEYAINAKMRFFSYGDAMLLYNDSII